MATAIQFALACLIGGAAFIGLSDDPNPRVPYLGGFIAGVGGQWAVMFAYVWLRHGWRAARSLTYG